MSVIITIDVEENDLTDFTTTSTGGGDLSVQDYAALAGTNYGVSFVINDTGTLYAFKEISPNTSGVFRARVYFDPNNISMGDNEEFTFFLLREGSYGDYVAAISLYHSDLGGYKVRPVAYNDASGNGFTGNLSYSITDDPHYFEIIVTRASTDSASDGSAEFWIDGVSKVSASDIDNYDTFSNFGMVYFIALGLDANTSGEFYMDECVVNDDGSEIGPLSGLIAGSACWGHLTGVVQDNVRTFVSNWTGTAYVTGTGDSEKMEISSGELMVSEVVNTGTGFVSLSQNVYDTSGDDAIMEYRHGATEGDCTSDTWKTYTGTFTSLGYAQIKLSA